MNRARSIKLIVAFTLAVSLSSVQGPMLRDFHLSTLPLARAMPAPSESWYPAGPAMNYLQNIIFVDDQREFDSLAATPSIDLTDVPLYSNLVPQFNTGSRYYLGSSIEASVSGIDFNLANNYWGCSFNFGNNGTGNFPDCGRQIRQGIAHMIDRSIFSADEPAIGGYASPADNPTGLNLPTPNSCGWDTLFPELGGQCTVGPNPNGGGVAYHLATATGVNYPWQPSLGSPDFCAAAQHFIQAGIATQKNGHTCVLGGLSPGVGANPVQIFIRSDNEALIDLGYTVAQEICALFTGSFTSNCDGLNYVAGSITSFPGFISSSTTQPNLAWWIYTSGGGSHGFLDLSTDMMGHFSSITWKNGPSISDDGLSSQLGNLYSTYLSIFTTLGPYDHPQCASSRVSQTPSNYGYVCNPAYDTVANAMAAALCFKAPADPTPGQVVPTFANCSGGSLTGRCNATANCSAVSAGYQAEDILGKNVLALPVFVSSNQYGYLSNWSRVIEGHHGGIFNSFAWLDAYSASPGTPGTLRQGFSQGIGNVNPYAADNPWDLAPISAVYDSLFASDPGDGSSIDWLAINTQAITNSGLSYTPPPGTVLTYRYTLRDDIVFQDGNPLTAWDVKFSYATLDVTGSYFSALLQPIVCSDPTQCFDGVTVLSPHQVDIHVTQAGLSALPRISSLPILPGRDWSRGCFASAWDGFVSQGSVPDSCMIVDPRKVTVFYDPMQDGIFIGSGPWMCRIPGGHVGKGCSSTGSQVISAGQSLSLTRFGIDDAPATSVSGAYFRSAGNLALWIWSEQNDANPSTIFGAVASCYGKPVDLSGSCAHWQQGIGNNPGPAPVGSTQVAIENRFYALNWVAPFNWATAPPQGIGPLPPVLYEGSAILYPASVASCTLGYPQGGYDC